MGLIDWLLVFYFFNVGIAALADRLIITRWDDIRDWMCKHDWHIGETFCNRCGRRM